MRVVIVGAGISSALISSLLRQHYGDAIKLVVYEKTDSIGGRMKTSYETEGNTSNFIDVGFQYMAMTESNPVTTKLFGQLIDDHVIELFAQQNTVGINYSPGVIDYVAPRGAASIVQYFFDKADVEMHLSTPVTKIDFNASNDKYVIYSDDKQLDECKAVIVTVPVPQVLNEWSGSIADIIEENKEVKEKLAQVKYDTHFALGLFYPSSVKSINIPWKIYCLNEGEHEIFCFIVVTNAKRNNNQAPFSLIAHSTSKFGARHAEEDVKIVEEKLKEELFRFLPDLPRCISSSMCHKWKYSQTDKRCYPNNPGYVVLKEQPLLILAGDSFARDSTMEPCAEAAVETVKRFVATFQ